MGAEKKPEFHQLKSELFHQEDVPKIYRDEANLHIPRSLRAYKPELAHKLKNKYPVIRFQESQHPNDMWLLLTEEAPNVVMAMIMNGDDLDDSILDIFNAHALTQTRGLYGANVPNLSVLSIFADQRGDLPSKKDLPEGFETEFNKDQLEEIQEMAIVLAQASWTEAVATLMKYTAKVNTHVIIDSHSSIASEQFKAVGIETVNITTAKLMIENLRRNGFLKGNLETMIVGVDFGNLALAKKLRDEEGFGLGIIRKHRTPSLNGSESKTKHELVHGDVRGKRVILMDDMIGSGGTILETIKLLLQHGAAEIIVCAAHAVFAGREYYGKLQEVLKNDKVKMVMLTDTLPLERSKRGEDKDKPYVFVKNERGRREKREVEMLGVDKFITYIIGVMLANSSAKEITQAMGEHVLPQADGYELYHQITGKKVPKPTVTAAYLSDGKYETLAELLLRRHRAKLKAEARKEKAK